MLELNENNFTEEVLNADKKVLVDFNAEWCGPCKMMKPILDGLAKEKENIKFVSVNVDNNENLAREYNVFSIPCLVIIENGKESKRSVGMISKSDLEDFIGE